MSLYRHAIEAVSAALRWGPGARLPLLEVGSQYQATRSRPSTSHQLDPVRLLHAVPRVKAWCACSWMEARQHAPYLPLGIAIVVFLNPASLHMHGCR